MTTTCSEIEFSSPHYCVVTVTTAMLHVRSHIVLTEGRQQTLKDIIPSKRQNKFI